jgi:glycosyltransferase involved in cell wall biosynthesis
LRILVISNLFPPIVRGGFEVECSGVVERLSEHHDVLVLSSDLELSASGPPRPSVRRELPFLSDDWKGAIRAPRAAVEGVAAARRTLAWKPELVYCWNPSNLPQAALRVLADAPLPVAFRVCDHSLGGLFVADQFMRELLPAGRPPPRALWSLACRALNGLPRLRLEPAAPFRTAICWNSEFIRSSVHPPQFVEPVLERVVHSVPRHGALYEAVVRDPAPEPEIVFLGRVTPYKGLEVAIRALALLSGESALPVRLVVIGPEEAGHGAELRALAASLGVADAVTWLGQQSPEQASARLARAHALIVPSLWEEPFPLVTIEGALAGVPVVAADVGGIGEGMHDGEHALLYPARDAAAAAAALARTLSETEETAARVARARLRAAEFGLEAYLEQQERFVEDAAAALA